MSFSTYILYSKSHNRLYIGQSSDYLKRFEWHNELSKKIFTVRYRPWEIFHVEHFETRSEAIQRERFLKSGQGRAWIRSTLLK
ncbi:MAG: GIY-YIG nuclease family protein [Flavobacteriales bacterium]|nr:GIY-YIG nuclease family protein [Flavobacteriales bacterium]